MGGARGRQGPAGSRRLNVRRRDGFRERGLQVTRLETFVDAAFAFALTLLVIGAGQRPESYAALHDALRRIPTFLACFALIAGFWAAHERFSRRFGIEDRTTVLLSLAIVALTLMFVYPLRMVISSGFWLMTAGWVPTELAIDSVLELETAFRVFAAGFASLSLALLLLNAHALRHAVALELDARELLETRGEVRRHAIDISVALLSVAISFMVLGSREPWVLGMPGFVYGLLAVLMPLHARDLRRKRAAL